MFYLIKTQSGEVIGRLELASDLLVEPEKAAAPPPPPKKEYRRVMTDAAGTFSYEDYLEQGWSNEALIDNGLMRMEEVVPEAPVPPGEVHPSVAGTQLGAEWEAVPEPPTPVPTPPPAPVPDVPPVPGPAVPGPAVPPPPAPVPDVPPAPGPAVPPPPAAETQGGAAAPEGCEWAANTPPVVPGREFMIRGVSYERLMDKSGVFFDGRIHGVTADNVPAAKKDGTFKAKRGVDKAFYQQCLDAQQGIHAEPSAPPPPGPAVPPPPAAGAAVPPPPGPAVPPPPAGAAPQTAPPPPANIKDLESSLQEWGEEM